MLTNVGHINIDTAPAHQAGTKFSCVAGAIPPHPPQLRLLLLSSSHQPFCLLAAPSVALPRSTGAPTAAGAAAQSVTARHIAWELVIPASGGRFPDHNIAHGRSRADQINAGAAKSMPEHRPQTSIKAGKLQAQLSHGSRGPRPAGEPDRRCRRK